MNLALKAIDWFLQRNEAALHELKSSKVMTKSLEEQLRKEREQNAHLSTQRFLTLLGQTPFDRRQSHAEDYKVYDPMWRERFSDDYLWRVGQLSPCRSIIQLRKGQVKWLMRKIETQKTPIGWKVVHTDPDFEAKPKDLKQYKELLQKMRHRFMKPAYLDRYDVGEAAGQVYENWFYYGRCVWKRNMAGSKYKPELLSMELVDPRHIKRITPEMVNALNSVMRPEDPKLRFDPYRDKNRWVVYNEENRPQLITEGPYFSEWLWNPTTRTDRIWRGQGVVEMSLRELISFKDAMEMNHNSMSESRIRDILYLKGLDHPISVEKLREFRTLIHAAKTGVDGVAGIPIMDREVGKLSLDKENIEEQYRSWMTLLTTLIFANSETDPGSVGMASTKGVWETSKMFNEERVGIHMVTKDRGLKTFISDYLEALNSQQIEYANGKIFNSVVHELSGRDDIIIDIAGIDPVDAKLEQDILSQKLNTSGTLREAMTAREADIPKELEGLKIKNADGEDVCILDIPAPLNNTMMQLLGMAQPMPEGEDGQAGFGDEEGDMIPDDQAGFDGMDEETENPEPVEKSLIRDLKKMGVLD